MTQTLSYTDFFNQARGDNNARRNNYQRRSNGGYNRPSTKAQHDLYYTLCERKNVKPARVEQWDSQRLSREIDRLDKLPTSPSPAQLEKIMSLHEELSQIIKLEPLTKEFIDSLTGGRNGTASSFIETLQQQLRDNEHLAPPTEQQIRQITSWFLCPDIPFEAYNINTRITTERFVSYSTETNKGITESGREIELSDSQWILMTPEEFASELKRKLKREQAREFIGRYQSTFLEWAKTRLSQGQEQRIRQLEEDLMTLEPTSFGVAFNIRNGEIVEEEIQRPNSRLRMETHDAYTPLTELEIKQMSFERASEYISQLQMERSRRQDIQTMYGEDGVFGEAQDTFEADNTFHINSKKVAKEDEWNRLIDLVFAMESLLGYNVDKAHEIAGGAFVEGTGDDAEDELYFTDEGKTFMREFFLSTISHRKEDNIVRWARDVDRLYAMVEDCQTVIDLLPSIEEL